MCAQEFISEDEVKAEAEKSFDELRKREWACDIRISDFLFDNYRQQQIFYAPSHPTPNVILEMVQRILKFMDITDMTFQNMNILLSAESSLIGQDAPIYPRVQKIFGLPEDSVMKEYYANRYFWSFKGDYIKFLTEYVKYAWKDKVIPT